MAMKFIKVYYDWLDGWEPLSMEERGRMMTILLQFARGEAPMEPEGNERYALPMYRQYVIRDKETYEDICQKRRVAGKLGAEKRRRGLCEVEYGEDIGFPVPANADRSYEMPACANKSYHMEANASKCYDMEASADKSLTEVVHTLSSRMALQYQTDEEKIDEWEEKKRRAIKMLLEYEKK